MPVGAAHAARIGPLDLLPDALHDPRDLGWQRVWFSVRQIGELNTDSKDYFWHAEEAPDTRITGSREGGDDDDRHLRLRRYQLCSGFPCRATARGDDLRRRHDHDTGLEKDLITSRRTPRTARHEVRGRDTPLVHRLDRADTQLIKPLAASSPTAQRLLPGDLCARSPRAALGRHRLPRRPVRAQALRGHLLRLQTRRPSTGADSPSSNLGLGGNREVEKT